jgi:hypothetical protein
LSSLKKNGKKKGKKNMDEEEGQKEEKIDLIHDVVVVKDEILQDDNDVKEIPDRPRSPKIHTQGSRALFYPEDDEEQGGVTPLYDPTYGEKYAMLLRRGVGKIRRNPKATCFVLFMITSACAIIMTALFVILMVAFFADPTLTPRYISSISPYSTKIRNMVNLDFRSHKQALKEVKRAARMHMANVANVTKTLIDYMSSSTPQQPYQYQHHPWGDGGHSGGYPPSTVPPSIYDPIDSPRHSQWGGGYHTMYGNGWKGKIPPLCPLLQDHLRLSFDTRTLSFDPFGLPCALEMHWSQELDTNEILRKGADFVNGEAYQSNSAISKIECTRQYRIHGFTPWSCKEYPNLPTRYSLVHNIGCVDVDSMGNVNVKSSESPAGRETVYGNDSPSPINPAYNRSVQEIQEGHYCYINYAVTENVEWRDIKNMCAFIVLLSIVYASFWLCGISTSGIVIAASSFYVAINCTTGLTTMVYLYQTVYISEDWLWLLKTFIPVFFSASILLYSVVCMYGVMVQRSFFHSPPIWARIIDGMVQRGGIPSIVKSRRDRYTARAGVPQVVYVKEQGLCCCPGSLYPSMHDAHLSDDDEEQ